MTNWKSQVGPAQIACATKSWSSAVPLVETSITSRVVRTRKKIPMKTVRTPAATTRPRADAQAGERLGAATGSHARAEVVIQATKSPSPTRSTTGQRTSSVHGFALMIVGSGPSAATSEKCWPTRKPTPSATPRRQDPRGRSPRASAPNADRQAPSPTTPTASGAKTSAEIHIVESASTAKKSTSVTTSANAIVAAIPAPKASNVPRLKRPRGSSSARRRAAGLGCRPTSRLSHGRAGARIAPSSLVSAGVTPAEVDARTSA